jgi:hypothetical protein
LTVPGTALAGTRAGALDLYFIPSAKVEVGVPGFGRFDDEGDGYGIRARLNGGGSLILQGEYQSTEYDDVDGELDQLRLGFGLVDNKGLSVHVEYVDAELDDEGADGFGFHARMESALTPTMNAYGQVGYLMLEDDTEDQAGVEFSIGLVATLSRQVGAFVDYRRTSLDGEDSEIELEFEDLRVGIRLSF